ncbi:DNA mismatch repair protein MutL [Salinisphaera sp. PC39]|uniref:DNA mismatch repair endonuclease MutL n=1 Tax=Salinisphaera sp. PC39 TaxID=1304156 RepID=UPI003340D44A
MPIRVLDPQLISQIAAGEVVERPASVVKELMENSLDAGAASVTVELEAGGLRLIRVRDDGRGIGRDELPLALARHATSKIDSLDALERVASLGFRGEALPSIASVSTLTLTSRAADEGQAHAVTGRGDDDVPVPRPAPHPPGTTVEVRDLFAKVPARRKFLRTEATELRHAQRVFRTIALSRFDVAFRLRHNGRELLHLPAVTGADGEAERRIGAVCGEDFLEHAVRVEHEAAGMRLTGWIATPGFSRAQADLQYSFVNDRMVRDRLFNHAVRRAYEDVLHNQRHPAYVLFLALDPAQVDVNAHPAKAEVRFRESRLVHDFVFRTLHAALDDHGGGAGEHDHGQGHRVELPVRGAPGPAPPRQGGLGLGAAESAASYAFQAPAPSSPAAAAMSSAPAPASADTPAMGYALGQLHGIYILAENADGLILVDMHAAHERILYERLKRELAAGGMRQQPLLVPATLRVTETEAELAERHADDLAGLGVELSRSGPAQVTLRALPSLLGDADGEGLVRDVLSDLAAESGADRVRRALDEILGDMGCRAAIKAGRRLSHAEMNALLRDMEGTERAGHCNHGRPSWVQVDLAALDRMFMRGQ